MLMHMANITGINVVCVDMGLILSSLTAPFMIMFYVLSGYTISVKKESILSAICKKTKAILLPYYKFSVVIILLDAILFLGIEKKSLTWFIDGTVGVLLQFQSLHWLDRSIAGVHPMFYGVLAGWYLFQYAVALVVYIPLLYKVNDKSKSFKLLCSLLLLLLGAVLYKMNLQGLNGEFFPTVCKILILPNIPGIAGLLMIGNYMSSLSILNIDKYSLKQKIICVAIALICIITMCIYDDHIYDFPIGKWGAFGATSYYIETIFGLAVVMLLAVLCNMIKKCAALKRFLLFFGDNSMDYLVMHLYVAYLVARVAGFWFYFLSEPAPTSDISIIIINSVILIIGVFVLCSAKIMISKRIVGRRAGKE